MLKFTDASEVGPASISRAMMMEAVRTSETSVSFNVTTRRYIPEGSKLQFLTDHHAGKYEDITVVRMTTLMFCIVNPCRRVKDTNISEKHTVSIFRAERGRVPK
jgi:hypothetical protein